MNQSLSLLFKRIFFSTLAKNVLFLGSEGIVFYRYAPGPGAFKPVNGSQGAPKTDFPKNAVLVVGREFYFEINHTFPITAFRDLIKAVALEAPALAPRDYCRYAFYPKRGSRQSRVNIWFFHPELKDWIDRLKPMTLLPESALVGLSENGKAAAISYGSRRGHFLFCFRKSRGDLLSRLVPEGKGEKEALLEFKRLAGYEAGEVEATFLGASTERPNASREVLNYYSTLTEKLQTFPPRRWPRFLCWERFLPGRISRRFFYFSAALLLLFFLFPLVFSYWHEASVNRELISLEKQIAKQAGLYLTMKEEVDRKTVLLKKVQAPIMEYVPKTVLLSEIGRFLKPPEDALASFRLVGDNLEIRGDTQSSSDLMARLGKSLFFADVRLSSPVVKDQKSGKERFVIEITVKKPPGESVSGAGREESFEDEKEAD